MIDRRTWPAPNRDELLHGGEYAGAAGLVRIDYAARFSNGWQLLCAWLPYYREDEDDVRELRRADNEQWLREHATFDDRVRNRAAAQRTESVGTL